MDEFFEEVLGFVVDRGLDRVFSPGPEAGALDLAPVLAALEALKSQGDDMFAAISRPSQTAGEEMADRAVTAYSASWFDDSLRDAQESIQLYPYNSRPRFVGGLAALALGRGDAGLELLVSAVKYSRNGQPEIGAVSALVAAHVTQAVGGRKLAQSLLQEADEVTGGRCPAVVGTLWRHGVAATEERLKELWWHEHAPAPLEYKLETFDRLLAATTSLEPGYLTAGEPFRAYLRDLERTIIAAKSTFEELNVRLGEFGKRRRVGIDVSSVKKALLHTSLGLKIGFWDSSVSDVLSKCQSLPDGATWPGALIWGTLTPTSPGEATQLFHYVDATCRRLLGALDEVRTMAIGEKPSTQLPLMINAQPHLDLWSTALTAVVEVADPGVARQAARAWRLLLAEQPVTAAAPVLHLDGVSSGLFEQIANSVSSVSPRANPESAKPFVIDLSSGNSIQRP
ncbi:hypothetical protein [Kineosporia babensis]|uniref:Uncharacterized protein n=1 Tax=Kineosporia babensis TaxID=499548 RepID=A0A9X1NND2_9ACTN|nr:hypothetical protein [Kineosporia babensis]MCD5316669.1 hypothetical protein [Kineosporia babensis]